MLEVGLGHACRAVLRRVVLRLTDIGVLIDGEDGC